MSINRRDIEPGMVITFKRGMMREVVAVDLEATPKSVTYRQGPLGMHDGRGCIQIGKEKTMILQVFASSAVKDITESLDKYHDWMTAPMKRMVL